MKPTPINAAQRIAALQTARSVKSAVNPSDLDAIRDPKLRDTVPTTPVTASLNAKDLAEIQSPRLQAFVKKFATSFKVQELHTDGFGGGDGSTGAEIVFTSGSKSSLTYGANVLDAKDLAKLSSLSAAAAADGFELELNMGEGGLHVSPSPSRFGGLNYSSRP